jgi:uncharacterized protein
VSESVGAVVIREFSERDLSAVHALNRAHESELSPLDEGELVALVDMAFVTWVAELDGSVVGFAVVFVPGVPYESHNYRWFSERYDDFVYLDRIAIAPHARRRGIAGQLYDRLDDLARQRQAPATCEVNVVPRNDASLAFHESRGFLEVGELGSADGTKMLRMLLRPVDAHETTRRE